ncbi:ribonuclease J [Spiroplasma endosymbiont of Amphibalanus improvisus]|uniref:ribonuclease J n=1 Tax=Spiroplasma endosymbiont of Amphibalanus improvisus TaxID=3066327 RepID=UPI00313AFCD3
MANINFFALGGLDERGKNLYGINVDGDIFLFDLGVKNPDRDTLGIDTVIPNFEYLKKNKKNIKGVFVSKVSAENCNAIAYLLKEINVPVYGSQMLSKVLKFNLTQFKLFNRFSNFVLIKNHQIINFDKVKIEIFSTTTGVPNSFGFVIHTADGKIVYTGDYIFDNSNNEIFATDIQHLSKIGMDKNVLLLLSESSSALNSGFTAPDHKITNYISKYIKESKGRVIFFCFDQDIHKIYELANLLENSDFDEIGVYGQNLIEALSLKNGKEYSIGNIKLKLLVNLKNKERNAIIVTGTGQKLYNRLIRIAQDSDDLMKIREDDTIILATPPVSGNELSHAKVLDELTRTNAKVVTLSSSKVKTMNASYEDIKQMVSLIKPKYFIPVRGLYKDFIGAKNAAIEAGVSKENVLIADNGQLFNFKDKEFKKNNILKIPCGDTFVDGIGIGDIGPIVLNDRKQLANDGVLIVGVAIGIKTKKIISTIDIQMRGVMFISETKEIFKKIEQIITSVIDEHRFKFEQEKEFDLKNVRFDMQNKLSYFSKKQIGKNPIILSIIKEI